MLVGGREEEEGDRDDDPESAVEGGAALVAVVVIVIINRERSFLSSFLSFERFDSTPRILLDFDLSVAKLVPTSRILPFG
jgi:hypothetical protein